ncbi:MAG: rhomboid family intramembrane serine protease [Lachnospiraceae bacterium]|nr:rhomboid family intramembrane serine protease [Lachnospiraceae bacterium]MCD8329308.1 rhomboid family intramembrane serine protease [Lachnospiraceae bacterium]
MFLFRRIHYNAPVVLTFFFLSLGALLLGEVTGGRTNTLFFSVYASSWLDPLTYVRLFGHVLGHASITHWTGNMTLFLLLGPILEEKYGSRRLLIMILIVAGVTGIVNMVFFPGIALMGASGIVFMMMILSSVVSVRRGEIPLTLILVAVIYLGQEVYDGLFTSDNISHLSHIIGGACGCVFGFTRRT